MKLAIDRERLLADLALLGRIGLLPGGGITRRALSREDAEARAYVIGRLREAGLTVRHDEVGNVRARRAGRRALPPVATGSHLDSVPSGGRLDGPLGVVGAVAAVEALARAGVETERPIEVIVFVGEEGSRFPRGTIGSAAVSGYLAVAAIHELSDEAGVRFADALKTYGDEGAPLPAQSEIDSFVELHVEQGGVLEAEAIAIGAVTAIAGLSQHAYELVGDANHAGATPMNIRRDALAAAARLVLHIEESAHAVGGGAVGTVGQLSVQPGGKNIIPGRVELTCDLRAPSVPLLDEMVARVEAWTPSRGVTLARRRLQRVEPGPMHERAIAAVERAAAAAGLPSRRMVSGAIHDALHMAERCPSSMIFVPSIGGKSHCPDEDTAPEHLVNGCTVLAHALVELANRV